MADQVDKVTADRARRMLTSAAMLCEAAEFARQMGDITNAYAMEYRAMVLVEESNRIVAKALSHAERSARK